MFSAFDVLQRAQSHPERQGADFNVRRCRGLAAFNSAADTAPHTERYRRRAASETFGIRTYTCIGPTRKKNGPKIRAIGPNTGPRVGQPNGGAGQGPGRGGKAGIDGPGGAERNG